MISVRGNKTSLEMASSDGPTVHEVSLKVEHLAGLGNTFVATEDIAAGALILREKPLLVASPLADVEPELQDVYCEGAEELSMELDDLLIAHAFARSSEAVRERATTECCGQEACYSKDHHIITSASATASWCRANDPACAALPVAELERVLCVFACNAFGFLADGYTRGATSLFVRASKFTHRCLDPSVVFHGQGGALCFRATRPIAKGEVPTISYLGWQAHCGTPRRRRLLLASKGFLCGCDDCVERPDAYRQLPCPECYRGTTAVAAAAVDPPPPSPPPPRDAATGLMLVFGQPRRPLPPPPPAPRPHTAQWPCRCAAIPPRCQPNQAATGRRRAEPMAARPLCPSPGSPGGGGARRAATSAPTQSST